MWESDMHTVSSFLLFSLSFWETAAAKPDRVHVLTEDYLLFPAIQERTQLRAGKRRSVCLHARSCALLLKQEGEKKCNVSAHTCPCARRRWRRKIKKTKKMRRQWAVCPEPEKKKTHLDYWSSLTCRKEAKVVMRRQKESVWLFTVTQRRTRLRKPITTNIKAAAGQILPFNGDGRQVADGTDTMPAPTFLGRPSETLTKRPPASSTSAELPASPTVSLCVISFCLVV